MRVVWSGILVVLLLAGGVVSAGLVRAQAAPGDYLPSSLFLPHADCFRIEGEGVLDFPGLVARFPGVPDAATVLSDLGWQAGAYRQYACDTPPTGHAGWIDIGVHQFATEAGARAAAPYFAEARVAGTALQMVPGVTAVTGPAFNGTEYTQYVAYGNLLFRVTGVAPSGSPQPDVAQVATMQLAGAAIVNSQEQVTAPVSPASYPYAITDLGTEYGNWSTAFAINNSGQVLWQWGVARDSLDLDTRGITAIHIMLTQEKSTTNLSELGFLSATILSDSGVILGRTEDRLAILYTMSTGEIQLIADSTNTVFADINSSGTIVTTDAVLLGERGSFAPPVPTGFARVSLVAINDQGWVVGTASDQYMTILQRAVLITDEDFVVLDPAPGAAGSNAVDLNDLGQVIGNPQRMGMRHLVQYGHAFLYDHTTGLTTDLGSLPGYQNSTPAAINNAEQVVGAAWAPLDESRPFRAAFIYDHRRGTMVDLNSLIDPASGWHLVNAFDINDSGQIVGSGHMNGETHAFVMTPNP